MRPLVFFGLVAWLLLGSFAIAQEPPGDTLLDLLEVQVFHQKHADLSSAERLIRLEKALGLPPTPTSQHGLAWRLSRLATLPQAFQARMQRQKAIQAYQAGLAAEHSGRSEAALDAYQHAINADPGLFEAYNNLAHRLSEQGRVQEAETVYRRALAFAPHQPLLYRNLGVLYEHMGRQEEAVAMFKRYTALLDQPDPPIEAILANNRDHPSLVGGDDYLAVSTSVTDGQSLRWPLTLSPIRYYIDFQQPEHAAFVPMVQQAMRDWTEAMHGELQFKEAKHPVQAQIILILQEGAIADPYDGVAHARFETARGADGKSRLEKVHVIVHTGWPEDSDALSARLAKAYPLILHELGHALGIWGHSPDSGDIMYTHPVVSSLSARDQRTIRRLYRLAPSRRVETLSEHQPGRMRPGHEPALVKSGGFDQNKGIGP